MELQNKLDQIEETYQKVLVEKEKILNAEQQLVGQIGLLRGLIEEANKASEEKPAKGGKAK